MILGLILMVIIGYLMTIMILGVTPTWIVIYFLKLFGIEIDPDWFSNTTLMDSIDTDVKPSKTA